MDTFQAVEIRDQYNKDLKRLNRATMPTLRDTYAAQLKQRGIETVYGGPVTREEHMNAILNERYPRAQMDEVTHVLYHKPGENWSACEHCNPAPSERGYLETAP